MATPGAGAERRGEVAGLPLFWRETPTDGVPILYLHGVPTSSDDFVPFLERTGGLAPDLPGFGRSGKPAEFDYSIRGYGRFLEGFLDAVGVERFSLVAHDWGAVGLELAQRAPERVERLVLLDAVPLLPGYRWHRIARAWRTPLIGELAMGFTTRRMLKWLSRRATATGRPVDDELIDRVWEHFDHGTQRAILKLYRSAPPEALAAAGARLAGLTCPTLVVWGAEDPYVPASLAEAYAAALGGPAKVEVVAGAGHWPWIDRPETIEVITDFLA